ncbi:GNAT family N-acetyltransferase [Longispora albida]|uniref:GNAT family N-acetyltransferase n=1 Tax=Longispora albida TaxID=203523 RepID=UPI0003803250|nr:GNAT family N-acetyltransferase [Longispora albida]
MREPELETERLRLRRWQESDREPFAALNADPEVMEYFSSPLSREQSDRIVDLSEACFDERGYSLWEQTFDAHFTPAVEIGWRFARSAWGHGYATEAARAVLEYAFGPLGLAEIVSMTATANERSIAVMRRLGMASDPAENFDHPKVPEGSPLRRNVLYRIKPS